MQTIDVAIVHGSPPIREGLAEVLGRRPDLRVVGVYASLAALRQSSAAAGVVLCDLAAGTAGPAVANGPARLLGFNVADEDRAIIECVQVGASGCVLRDADLDEMVASIHAVAAGVAPCSARVVTSLFRYVAGRRDEQHPVLSPSLTGREEQILRLLASGLSNRQIAEQARPECSGWLQASATTECRSLGLIRRGRPDRSASSRPAIPCALIRRTHLRTVGRQPPSARAVPDRTPVRHHEQQESAKGQLLAAAETPDDGLQVGAISMVEVELARMHAGRW